MADPFEPLSNEHAIRMGHALLLNALELASAWRFVRGVADAVQRVCDAVLLWLAVQYASVMVCGLAGVLNASTMTAAALVACAAMWFGALRGGRDDAGAARAVAWERYVAWACAAFLVGYSGAVLWNQRFVAVMSDDALTYHVPAAVRWLQTGRLVFHQTWFFNPANTYSPLAGSAFVAWWFAPLNNDWLARFVQVPGLALIFVTLIRFGRLLGAPIAVAALVALAAALSRPFMRQIIVTKDDLYLAGFFLAAVVALARDNASDRLGPWRVGIALGLFLATKYTALLAMPMLLFMIDAPVKAHWRWKQWGLAAGVAMSIAGPWFVRNWWVTGNPLFPIDVNLAGVRVFEGMFTTSRSEDLRTLTETPEGRAGLWRILTGTYFSMLPPLFVTLLVAWAAAAVVGGWRVLRDPVARTCVFGPIIGIAAFAFTSPYAEVRFVDPAFLLLFGCAALSVSAAPVWAAIPLGVLLLGLSVFTGFTVNRETFIGAGAAVAVVTLMVFVVHEHVRRLDGRLGAAAALAAALALAAYLYVNQDADVHRYEQLTHTAWVSQYGPIADGWAFVSDNVPDDAVLAYTNTQFTYPLIGFEGDRRLAYAPTRPGVTSLHMLPRLEEPVSGERLVQELARVTVGHADRDTWLNNLRAAGADYLFVPRAAVVTEPPELAFARAESERFEPVFENEAVVVYRIRREVR